MACIIIYQSSKTNKMPFLFFVYCELTASSLRLRWSWGRMLASGTQVRGFEPGRSRRIFQGEKILSIPSFGAEVKTLVPCRRFAACKRSLHWRGICHCRQNYQSFLAHISPFPARGLSRRCVLAGAWKCKWDCRL
jgi:hypothetical protein